MFEIRVEDVFMLTGRGYIIAGEIISNEEVLRIGDTLRSKDNTEQKIDVKAIEMMNYGTRVVKSKHIGLLTVISEEEAKGLIGKILFKE
ncbi:hypothetical protein [Gorillibacterium timonense]|uniref:hypothetical protein n=1 Tax=Gorillibacterium timonense TaxID=1689269 RepID=UPI00071E167D|nr:hypothetical protein [Gorillibacterium timonense]